MGNSDGDEVGILMDHNPYTSQLEGSTSSTCPTDGVTTQYVLNLYAHAKNDNTLGNDHDEIANGFSNRWNLGMYFSDPPVSPIPEFYREPLYEPYPMAVELRIQQGYVSSNNSIQFNSPYPDGNSQDTNWNAGFSVGADASLLGVSAGAEIGYELDIHGSVFYTGSYEEAHDSYWDIPLSAASDIPEDPEDADNDGIGIQVAAESAPGETESIRCSGTYTFMYYDYDGTCPEYWHEPMAIVEETREPSRLISVDIIEGP